MSFEKPWYMNAYFYQIYPRSFYDANGDGYGDFKGIQAKLDYIQSLGIDCIWIMPIYPSPMKDDGYDISDFCAVDPHFGTLEDFRELIEAVHAHGMRIIMDLVLNHCSDQHPWFQSARKSKDSPYRDYFVWSDNDQKYAETRIIFTDTQKSNWTWDEDAGQYFWHRFYPEQPDLNYDNPAVRDVMKDVMRHWMRLGIDGFRADAVPYLFERDGMSNENLPETHEYLKECRKLMDDEFPGAVLLCEANMWPQDVRPYFGSGDEFQLGFHFPLMPRIFKSIGKQNAASLVSILKDTPEIPENCQWCTFLRNHDELTLEMVTEEDRQWMWSFYAPDREMRKNLGIRRRLWPLLDNDLRKVMLAYSLLLTLPGSPVFYYGDEIGMGDNIRLRDRNGVRTLMQWSNSKNGGFSSAEQTIMPVIENEIYGYQRVNVEDEEKDPDSKLNHIRQLMALRKTSQALGSGRLTWLVDGETIPVLAYIRETDRERVIVVQNMTEKVAVFPLELEPGRWQAINRPDIKMDGGKDAKLTLAPWEFVWLRKE